MNCLIQEELKKKYQHVYHLAQTVLHFLLCLDSLIFQNFNLFSSEAYAPAKNLMFKDSTQKLVRVPPNTDSFLYLGADYMSIVHSLRKGKTHR